MPSLAATMSWVLQVVDRGASANVARYSRGVSELDRSTRTYRATVARTREDVRGYALSAASAATMSFALGLGIRSALRSYGAFNQQMKATQLTLMASSRDMAELTRNVFKLAGATEFKPQELGALMKTLGQAGLTASEILQTTKVVTDVATAGFMGLGAATELVVNVMKGFQVPASRATVVMDKMIRATQLTTLNMEDIKVALGFATGATRAYNQSIDSVLVSLALLKPITVTASKAGTSLRAGLQSVVNPRSIKLLEGIGVKAIDALGHVRDINQVMLEVQQAVTKQVPAGERATFLSQLFTARGLQLYTAVVDATAAGTDEFAGVTLYGADAVKELGKQVKNSAGLSARFADKLRSEYVGAIQRFDASAEKLKITLGDGLMPEVKSLALGFEPLISSLTRFMTFMDGWPAKILMYAAAWKAAAGAIQAASWAAGAFSAVSGMAAGRALGGGGVGGGVGGVGGMNIGTAAMLAGGGGIGLGGTKQGFFSRPTPYALQTFVPRSLSDKNRVRIEDAITRSVMKVDYATAAERQVGGSAQAQAAIQEARRRRGLAGEVGERKRQVQAVVNRERYSEILRRASAVEGGIASVDKTRAAAVRINNLGIKAANAGVALGNLLGPVGTTILAFESLSFAASRVQETLDALEDTEADRLRRAQRFQGGVGGLVELLRMMRVSPKGAGGEAVFDFKQGQKAASLMATLAAAGIDSNVVGRAARDMYAGKPISEVLTNVAKYPGAFTRLGLEEWQGAKESIGAFSRAEKAKEELAEAIKDPTKRGFVRFGMTPGATTLLAAAAGQAVAGRSLTSPWLAWMQRHADLTEIPQELWRTATAPVEGETFLQKAGGLGARAVGLGLEAGPALLGTIGMKHITNFAELFADKPNVGAALAAQQLAGFPAFRGEITFVVQDAAGNNIRKFRQDIAKVLGTDEVIYRDAGANRIEWHQIEGGP